MNRLACLALAGAIVALQPTSTSASDHADPINNPLLFWKSTPPEGNLTDLFVFPAKNGTQLTVILCVRPSLTGEPARLDQFEYNVHMDLRGTVSFNNPQNNARYGGTVDKPQDISETTTITYRLKGNGETREPPTIKGSVAAVQQKDIQVWGGNVLQPEKVMAIKTGRDDAGVFEKNVYEPGTPPLDETKVNIWTGISDDPFIFPNFFRTNVVAMVATIPMTYFPNQMNWIVWATSSKGGEQIDHVGRSLRTQNPRFEILNPLHPSKHVEAIMNAQQHPTLMRDVFVWLGINNLFAYRPSWDYVPDVMLFTRQPGHQFGEFEAVGADGKPSIVANTSDGHASFPNGRFLTDDVGDRLARYGDTLLKELSYVVRPCQDSDPPSKPECRATSWPRITVNDKLFQGQENKDQRLFEGRFPYLGAPWTGTDARLPAPKLALSTASVMKITIGLIVVVLVWLLTAWLIAVWIDHKRQRRRYL
jgi:hypothetical protein